MQAENAGEEELSLPLHAVPNLMALREAGFRVPPLPISYFI